jgi:hypothetical protein
VPYVHPFYSLVAKRDFSRDLRPFQCRDCVACQQIIAALARLGFELGEERLNNPPPVERSADPTRLAHVDTSDCAPADRLLTGTRLPGSDDPELCRKYVARGHTDLEQELIDVWKAPLPVLGRDRVLLHPELHRLLPDGFEDRYELTFYEGEGAPYKELRAYDGRSHKPRQANELRTAAFLLHLPRLPHRKTGYLGFWSLDGTSTLVWSKLLRHRHADLLRDPGFVMAELVGVPIPKRPTDLGFTLDWRAEILFQVSLGSLPQIPFPTGSAPRTPSQVA